MRVFAAILLCLMAISKTSNAQIEEPKIIQLSGFVMTADSLHGVPYVTIKLKNKNKGTISDFDGYFSFAVQEGQEIEFSSVGYKTNIYKVPKLDKHKYSMIQLLTSDTVYLPETFIYPWPSREEFKQAFINAKIPDDDLERAKRNLERERLAELGENMPYDGGEMSQYTIAMNAQKFHYQGQIPPMNIFNPIAWAKFIQAWKRGDFKKKN